jgi:hypothetical protein
LDTKANRPMFNTDQGAQFTAQASVNRLLAAGIWLQAHLG